MKKKTNSRAESILLDAYYASGHIAYYRDRIQALEDRKTSITCIYGKEAVQSSRQPDKLLESLAQIEELKAKANELLNLETEKELRAERLIDMLDYEDEKSTLRRLYLSRESVNEIAYYLGYAVQTVYNAKYRALKKLDAKLEEIGDV